MYGSGFNLYPAFKSPNLLSSLISLKNKINISSILTNTQKTLNVVNQAIPLVYQVKPIVNNAKTIFKVIGAIKSDKPIFNSQKKEPKVKSTYKSSYTNLINSNSPKFFI